MVHSDAEAIHTPFLISRQKAANESAMVKARGFAGSDRACAGVEPAPKYLVTVIQVFMDMR